MKYKITYITIILLTLFTVRFAFAETEIKYTPEACGKESNTINICFNENQSGGDTATIEVMANAIPTEALSAAISIEFDSSVLEFNNNYSKGNFFESGGDVNYLVAFQQGSNNKILIGVSLGSGSAGVKGSGRIITLQFRFKKEGTSNISFSDNENNLLDKAGEKITGITWKLGSVTMSQKPDGNGGINDVVSRAAGGGGGGCFIAIAGSDLYKEPIVMVPSNFIDRFYLNVLFKQMILIGTILSYGLYLIMRRGI